MPERADEPPFISEDYRCAIRMCPNPWEWRLLGTDEHIGFCRHHRDLIEDVGLELPDARA